MGPDSESIVHQVIVEAAAAMHEAEAVRHVCQTWAVDCAAARSLEPLGI